MVLFVVLTELAKGSDELEGLHPIHCVATVDLKDCHPTSAFAQFFSVVVENVSETVVYCLAKEHGVERSWSVVGCVHLEHAVIDDGVVVALWCGVVEAAVGAHFLAFLATFFHTSCCGLDGVLQSVDSLEMPQAHAASYLLVVLVLVLCMKDRILIHVTAGRLRLEEWQVEEQGEDVNETYHGLRGFSVSGPSCTKGDRSTFASVRHWAILYKGVNKYCCLSILSTTQ